MIAVEAIEVSEGVTRFPQWILIRSQNTQGNLAIIHMVLISVCIIIPVIDIVTPLLKYLPMCFPPERKSFPRTQKSTAETKDRENVEGSLIKCDISSLTLLYL